MSRVVVVGAGVIGLASAYVLTRRDDSVTVIDRGLPGGECSRGNGGWIVPSFSAPLPAPGLGFGSLLSMLHRDSPLYIDLRKLPALAPWLLQFRRFCNRLDYVRGFQALANLNEYTMTLFDALAADSVSFEMHHSGLLWAFMDAANIRQALRDFAMLDRLGYSAPEPLDQRALRDLEPNLSASVTGGFLVAAERHVRPESLAAGLTERLGQLGCQVHSGIDVYGAVRDGRNARALRTSVGDVHGDQFLIAAGAWTGQLTRKFGAPLPIEAGKGYSITLRNPTGRFGRPVYFAEAKAAISPFDDGLRVAGTMEMSGVNTHLDPRRLGALRRAAERYMAVPPRWNNADNWVGARPVTPDGLPIISGLPGYENVFVAGGHGMLGVTLAPATAALVADIMQGKVTDVGRPFDAARFLERRQ